MTPSRYKRQAAAWSLSTVSLVFLPVSLGAPDTAGAVAHPRKLVHRFDFDERDAGNIEDLPKYWEQYRPEGFPRFAIGKFDLEFGRSDKASFHLFSDGRNVAYHYTGPDVRVQPNTSYLVEGYIHPDHLVHGRAWLSAHFLDENQQPIAETIVRSPEVGGPAEVGRWVKTQMYLPLAPPQASTIGLIVWVVQEPVWNTSTRTRRHIPRTDVMGGAWFDDIAIHALPRLLISTSSPGNTLAAGSAQELRIILADYSDTALRGKLIIASVAGEFLETHDVPVSIGKEARPVRFDMSHLEPGIYDAHLEVKSGDDPVVSRSLRFARLGQLLDDADSAASPFGVVIDPRHRADPATELSLLRNLGVRSVKLPVWTGLVDDPETAEQRRASDRLLRTLVQDGFALTGVLFGPPSALVAGAGPYPRPLVEILSEDAGVWRDHLAAVVAPNASVFRWWQLGADNDPGVVEDDRLPQALDRLRQEMLPFINRPLLVVPGSTAIDFDAVISPARQLALTIGSNVHPAWFDAEIHRAGKLGYDHLSVYIEPLPEDLYSRQPRMADWARRVILARHAGANTVFVPQTWHVRRTVEGLLGEPTEEYLIYRTIAGILSDAAPGGWLRIDPNVHALVFHRGRQTVVAMWDSHAPPEGNLYAVQLGSADRQVDLAGRSTPLQHDETGRQIVRLTPDPVFVDGIERWLIEFRTSVEITPTLVDFGDSKVAYRLGMANGGGEPLSGRVTLAVAKSWKVSPSTFKISLPAGRSLETELELRFPHIEPAGNKGIIARISLNQGPYYLEVPLSFELGLSVVDAWGMVIVEGENLLLRQIVTNRSQEVLHFRGSANVPGRARQYQPITNLQPGDTAVAEYRFSGGAVLSGRQVRLILRELNDGSRLHNLELTVP